MRSRRSLTGRLIRVETAKVCENILQLFDENTQKKGNFAVAVGEVLTGGPKKDYLKFLVAELPALSGNGRAGAAAGVIRAGDAGVWPIPDGACGEPSSAASPRVHGAAAALCE